VLATRRGPSFFLSLRIVGRIPARPVWSPDGKTIAAYGMSAGDVPRLVLFDVANGTETALETGGEGVTGAAWLSSDTLVLGRLTRAGERMQLGRMAVPDGQPEPLTNDLMTYVGLDLDALGRSLVTARREASAVVWVGDATGSSGTEVTSAYPHRTIGFGARVAWAGSRLLYDTIAGGTATIMAVPTEGGSSTEIVPDAYGFAATADGRTIVHMRGLRGSFEGLWKNDGSGRPSVRLVNGEFAANPLLTPDGQRVAFVAIRSGIQTPWVVPVDGGDAVEVAHLAVGVGAQTFDISPDGRRWSLATVNEAGEPTLVVCDWPSCSNRRNFAVLSDFDAPLRWTRDGQAIAFVSQRGTNIWSMPLDGTAPRPITKFTETAARRKIADYAWSPDGTRLAIVFLTTSEDVVLISDLQGRAAAPQ
jgi:dipeptidyl aminopeptidase/acylaminoacyl peptidase